MEPSRKSHAIALSSYSLDQKSCSGHHESISLGVCSIPTERKIEALAFIAHISVAYVANFEHTAQINFQAGICQLGDNSLNLSQEYLTLASSTPPLASIMKSR